MIFYTFSAQCDVGMLLIQEKVRFSFSPALSKSMRISNMWANLTPFVSILLYGKTTPGKQNIPWPTERNERTCIPILLVRLLWLIVLDVEHC